MKVSIISSSFFESSIPLAKYLAELVDVKFYALFSNRFINPSNFDLTNIPLIINYSTSYLDYLPDDHYILNYLKGSKVDLKILVLNDNILKCIFPLYELVKRINDEKPDCIHFIGHHPYFIILYLLIKNKNIVHSFHEIEFNNKFSWRIKEYRNWLSGLFSNYVVTLSILKKSKLIFHSQNIHSQFLIRNKKNKTVFIPYGLFEIYGSLYSVTNFIDFSDYFLFLGYVRDYKGVDILIKAITEINKFSEKKNIKFVIAGNNTEGLYMNDLPSNVLIIDKFLNDFEIVELIKKCKAVIMPYRVASQSGIPNTVFLFNKPIICSDIPGLNDVILNRVNGLLFKSLDPVDLATKIRSLIEDNSMYESLSNNIIKRRIPILEWETLAKSTLEYYES